MAQHWDLIIPVPSSAASFYKRTFNQCALIALEILREHEKAKPDSRLDLISLRHTGKNPPQASLPHSRRLRNVRGAFQAVSESLRGASILLVDDVVTTGATSAAATAALLNAGCLRVDLVALARSTAWGEYRGAVYNGL